MTRKPRTQHVAVSFDGLTDAVTNLTGAIILLVVLVLGVTTEAPPQPREGAASAEGAADRTVESLLERAQAARLAIRGIEDGIRRREQELPELERRLESLRRKAERGGAGDDGSPTVSSTAMSTQADDPAAPVESSSASLEVVEEAATFLEESIAESRRRLDDLQKQMPVLEEKLRRLLEQAAALRPPERTQAPPEEPKPAREIRYRPPLEQTSDQQTLVFCCREGKILFVDVTVRRVAELDPEMVGRGEIVAVAQRPNSRFRRVLAANRPGSWCVNFAVWPDSYEAFLAVRKIAWNAGYDVGWYPMEPGEPLRLRPGKSIID